MSTTAGSMHSTFTIERHYPIPPERVFTAWQDPGLKSRWFAGPGAAHDMDFRVGGTETVQERRSGSEELRFTSTYQEIRPWELILYSSTMHRGRTLGTVSVTTVEFVSRDGGTRLVLTEHGVYLTDWEGPASREEGTAAWLDQLGAHLARAST
ncbi:SRPBCC family protein [Bogoriella caseilytica]|uniref:Uncharacterized protein YndB with AHSA1/START domain n=1 Tax=Bogoriella caseilytica TaxID=56055 RepID=A0A3N2BCC9_9MICO|nr:SRPBCC family protein [Bogoriella caseilytica]ROR72906.1 uncharacterized protein YndB with AHSA1/START domain [Bogoriella caseilytica]